MNNKTKGKKMALWKKGAIIGGIWGILSMPTYLLIGYMWWEKQTPEYLSETIFLIAFLPMRILSILFPRLFYSLFPEEIIKLILLNFFGWIFTGTCVGYLWNTFKNLIDEK